ncbi:Histone deacetylase clr3 [Rhodotorula toruloides ATCC 204091]|uniref:histone deacetylase n=1 Tax=Rhodotorula toruloides TaxID=5286 RepID=A0A0K3CJC1_RHOTO|nr:Histone deacetylase clr3 [Rhodotorula toruloides ATCC 204091]KAK4335851.1 Histone deacetylase HDA1 [Rhodotorula toruloides]PRQ73478.1 histone deacetylase clr3 [Rhodotorula toruloides]
MDGFSQPVYTQAIPADASQQSAPATQLEQPVASTSTAPATIAPVSAAAASAQVEPQPVDPPISENSAPLQPGQPRLFPFPEQDPNALPLTGFASVPARAAVLPNAQPYTRPPPYDRPNVELGKGLSRDPPPRRFVSEADIKASHTNGHGDLLRQPGVVREEEIATLTVDQLRKMGLGRAPSGFCYSARMTLHAPLPKTVDSNDPHPEQPARITGIFNKLLNGGLTSRMVRVQVREALREEVMLVHSEGHWERVRATGFQTIEYLETCKEFFERLSLYVNPDSAFCARLSCGGVIEMARAVAEGQIRNGFAIVRPPGHHAEPEEAMGFCFFNNAAVAAKWLRTVYGSGTQKDVNGKEIKMNRILILDWDVHHGNGTQRAFEDDDDILYISLHRHGNGFYPGGDYGALESVGSGKGRGFSVNIPFMNEGMGDADYLYAFQNIVMPIAYEYAPDLVIVSAGYDAAKGDELGKMNVSPDGYAHMTHMLSALAGGKLLLALEGGYNVNAIAESAYACVKVIVGDELPVMSSIGAASLAATNTVHDVRRMQAQYWKCMGEAVLSQEELSKAGKIESLSEVLKKHRLYELWHEYGLFDVEFNSPTLEEAYSNQLLVSENVYDADVLLLFMHDLGSMKAAYTAATLDSDLERTQLLDTSREVLDWAMEDHDFGVIDVNLLAHLATVKGQPIDAKRDKAREKELALYVWDQIVQMSSAQHVILFGSGAGCNALMDIVRNRFGLVQQRVRACVSVLGHEHPPELEASTGARNWYKNHSLVLLPSTHPLQEDARRAGKHQKKFGNVYRATAEDESRPTHLLRASMPKIKEFIAERVPITIAPAAATSSSSGGDIEMATRMASVEPTGAPAPAAPAAEANGSSFAPPAPAPAA